MALSRVLTSEGWVVSLTPSFALEGADSTGAPMPFGFETYAQELTPGTYGPTSITATGPGGTYIQTITYDGSGNVTNVSAWVKQ